MYYYFVQYLLVCSHAVRSVLNHRPLNSTDGYDLIQKKTIIIILMLDGVH